MEDFESVIASKLPGYEPRPAQSVMAGIIGKTIAGNAKTVIEAGTGTGKTLAYLIPAVYSRKKVVVSTGTKNLQEQIRSKDIPFLESALPVKFTAVNMKGRGNYLCRRRYQVFVETAGNPAQAKRGAKSHDAITRSLPGFERAGAKKPDRHFDEIAGWAEKTKTGDRAEIKSLPDDYPLWGEINSRSELCLGSKCPSYSSCFVNLLRAEAAKADIVIVNHHLFFADMAVKNSSFGEVIPPFQSVIFDEAHSIEDAATSFFGVTVSNRGLEELLRDTFRELVSARMADQGWSRLIDSCMARAEKFFAHYRAGTAGPDETGEITDTSDDTADTDTSGGRSVRRKIPPQVRRESALDAAKLAESLLEVAQKIAGIVGGQESVTPAAAAMSEPLEGVLRRIQDSVRELQFVTDAGDDSYVYWSEARKRGVALHASPIRIADVLRDGLYPRIESAVFTSATIAVDGSFAYFRERMGLEPDANGLDAKLESPFDYQSQAAIYIPKTMPEPDSSDFTKSAAVEIAKILTVSRGRAFVLFTSRKNMREVYEILAPELEYPVYIQGEMPKSELIELFRREKESVLFATNSFWQGVDVPGDALSCVILDKLPFASPGDPVVAARIDYLKRQKKNAFIEYQVPSAVLFLKQGVGRLIRTKTDKGLIAILDKRILSKPYGKSFLKSLPQAPVYHNLLDIPLNF